MTRRYGEPITVRTQHDQPNAFTWRGVTYHVRVIGRWRLATRWWETDTAVDRVYFRVQTTDQQIFEIYCETGGAGDAGDVGGVGGAVTGGRWILDVCLD